MVLISLARLEPIIIKRFIKLVNNFIWTNYISGVVQEFYRAISHFLKQMYIIHGSQSLEHLSVFLRLYRLLQTCYELMASWRLYILC